MNKARWRPY